MLAGQHRRTVIMTVYLRQHRIHFGFKLFLETSRKANVHAKQVHGP